MLRDIDTLFRQKNVLHHSNEGITICPVGDSNAGVDLAIDILHTVVDRKTALYLSGGSTPKDLYKKISKEEQLLPGAVGMVDERFGVKFHPKSNELMIRETGLLRYFEMRDVPFYPLLSFPPLPVGEGQGEGREAVAQAYDEKLRSLNSTFQKSVVILGIGDDGHTAGIPARKSKVESQKSKVYDNYDLVTEYNDEGGKYGERVTMTFLGLSMMDVLLVLVFGEGKLDALEQMFQNGSEEAIPARFYKRPEIAPKTIIITDQQV